ncbi:MAG: TetR/AcrR family transcriptional regulator [Pseudomonadota bacterium]
MTVIDRRKMILDAAAQSFAQYGYKATTMELVAKIANVGKGTIYTFFSTKEELFEEILNIALKEMIVVIQQGVKEENTFDQNLFQVMDKMMEFRAKHELFVKLAQEGQDVGTRQAMIGLIQMEKTVLEYISKEVDKAIQKGQIRQCNSAEVAYIMLKMYAVLVVGWNEFHEPMSNEQIKEYMGLLLFKGLL